MFEYIRELANSLLLVVPNYSSSFTKSATRVPGVDFARILPVFREEIDRLDPRDFVPAVRHDFLVKRADVRFWSQPGNIVVEKAAIAVKAIAEMIEHHLGVDSSAQIRTFPYIVDPCHRTIIERDYKELRLKLFPDGSWKSAVVMAGSILEAILYDRLNKDQATLTSAKNAASSVPNPPKNKKLNKMDEWTLQNLIDVSERVGIIPRGHADSVHASLRDFRNFVHPRKEIRSQHPCTEAEAYLAIGSLEAICNFIEQNP